MMEAFARGPVQLDAKPGGKFALFNGNIFGEFIEIVRNTNLVKKQGLIYVYFLGGKQENQAVLAK